MKVIGMISSGFDSGLTEAAANSLRKACDKVYILDGGIANADNLEDEPTNLAFAVRSDGYHVRHGSIFTDDAAKRTALLKWVQHENDDDCFGIVLDSDEVLLWGEYMRDFLALAEKRPATAAGGFPLRLVEFDGSVALAASRVYKLGAIDHYDLSSYTVTLAGSSAPITLPNTRVCYMHGMPLRSDDPRCRPPVQGEPHILHRTMLRSPGRTTQRQHEAELSWINARKPAGV